MTFVFLSLGYHPTPVGGAYRFARDLAERLAQKSHTVHVIYPGSDLAPRGAEILNDVFLHRFANESGRFWNNWRRKNRSARRRLAAVLRATKEPSVIVLHHAFLRPALSSTASRHVSLFYGPWGEEFLLASRVRRRSVLQCCLHQIIAAVMRREERSALRTSSHVFVLSDYSRKQIESLHGNVLPPVTKLSGGVDLNRFQPLRDRESGRVRWGLAPDQTLFVTVRRLDPRMGLLTLIDGFARIHPQFPRACLLLAGSGPQKEELEARIVERGLAGKARLLGFVTDEDLPILLNAADYTLMPSLDLEGFGLATAESLACGTPVLGSRAGATPELLLPLSDQLLFEAGSEDSLAAKLEAVLSNRIKLPARNECRAYAMRAFSWEGPVSGFESRCLDLAGAVQ